MKKFSRRNFLIIFTTIASAAIFLKWFNPFSENITLSEELYFSSFCSLIDNKKEFLSNYNLNESKKILHNQTLLGRYFVNTDELLSLRSSPEKSLQ